MAGTTAKLACSALLLVLPLTAEEVQPGTQIPIRLTSAVSTASSRVGDRVEARVIARVFGAVVRGRVARIERPAPPDGRAALLVDFTAIRIRGKWLPLAAHVTSVDNARETVDENRQIRGILASDTFNARLNAGIEGLSQGYSGLAGILSGMKNSMFQPPSLDIDYPAGVEMVLRLDAPLELPHDAVLSLKPMPRADVLAEMLACEPFRTEAQQPRLPSDITNLLLVGGAAALRRAFREAGWSAAAELSARSKLETLSALAEDRGYREAPVSLLLLDGKPPDMVWEKANNTFARRHHVRIWLRPEHFRGKPVWAAAATHDIALGYSESERTFVHRIDSRIDLERTKVVDDLLFTGRVRAMQLLDRPQVPRRGRNATGDELTSDGRIAVVWLK